MLLEGLGWAGSALAQDGGFDLWSLVLVAMVSMEHVGHGGVGWMHGCMILTGVGEGTWSMRVGTDYLLPGIRACTMGGWSYALF